MSSDDPRFLPDAYITDGQKLYRVLSVERSVKVRVWVEDCSAVYHEESSRWHYRQRCLTLQQARACKLVKAPAFEVRDAA